MIMEIAVNGREVAKFAGEHASVKAIDYLVNVLNLPEDLFAKVSIFNTSVDDFNLPWRFNWGSDSFMVKQGTS